MKQNKLRFVCAVLILSMGAKGQGLFNAAKKLMANEGIAFTAAMNTAEKRKEAAELSSANPNQPLYATVYVSEKIANSSDFRKGENTLSVNIRIRSEDYNEVSIDFPLNAADKEKKFSCFEFIPANPSLDSKVHKALAKYFGSLKPTKQTLTFYVNRGIEGKIELDFTNGIGKLGDIKKEADRKQAEEQAAAAKLAAEEQAKRDAARKVFLSAKDLVKVSFKNTCAKDGQLYIQTEDKYADFDLKVWANTRSSVIDLRPGNKVYNGNQLLYTVSKASVNAIVEFCPPKTDAEIKEEEFQKGFQQVDMNVNNNCGLKTYYIVETIGTSKTWLESSSSTSHKLKKGEKIWLATENGDKIKLLFEASTYSQTGQTINLCQ